MSDAHKGQTGYWLGKTFSDETRLKISRALKGKPAWNKGQGNGSEYQRYKNSTEHKEWRTQIFIRDNYTCQECGVRSGNGKRVELNADHIKPYALYPELRLELSNGRTLCLDCHYKTPTFGGNILTLRKQLTLTTF
jgi:5-methylcytosine-specific restriction endonuclease McrA